MSVVSKVYGDQRVYGTLTADSITLPSSAVSNSHISGTASIAASKMVHKHKVTKGLAIDTAIGTAGATQGDTEIIYVAQGVGTVTDFNVAAHTAPSTGTCYLQLYKTTAGGAATSVLSATAGITAGGATYTLDAASLNTHATLASGDVLSIKYLQTTHAGCTACLGIFGCIQIDERY